MDSKVQRWYEGYKALGKKGQSLFWIVGVATFAASFATIVLVGRNVDLAMMTATIAQVVSAAVISILASLLFLYLKTRPETTLVSPAPSEKLRDLIYFDFDKATSIFSQIEGGLLTEKQLSAEGTRERRQLARVGLRAIQPEFGTISSERTSVLESKVLHHDLLIRLEQKLEEMGLLLNINEAVASEAPDYSDKGLHDLTSKPSFVVAEGWATIEDYSRFDFIAGNFRELANFINRCAVEQIKQSAEYQSVQETLNDMREEIKQERNTQRKAQMKFQLKQIEQNVESMVEPEDTVEDLPDWLLKGIRSFITTFMPNRINLRIYPFEQNPDFAILSNLKRESFADSDLENVSFAYGTRPNVPLTVFGLITSIPKEEGEVFDPMADIEEDEGSEEGQFEGGFRQLFRAFEGFERFVRFSQYPRVTVYPIAVYQNLDKVVQDDADKSRSEENYLMSRDMEEVQLQKVE